MMGIEQYNITKIINYLRKSRKDEERERRTGEDTLAEQKALMTSILDKTGLPYDQEFEVGSGDKISSRPVFQKVMKMLEDKEYEAVAVKEISRLGRGSMSDMGQIYDLIVNHRIFIITPNKIYDPRNEDDLRQIRFEMFLSREEFESIRRRLVGARYTYAMQGKYMVGMTPFGYDYDSNTQKLTINEKQANIVRLIFDLYVNGIDGRDVSYSAITTYLYNHEIKSIKGNDRWQRATIKKILTNRVYIGEIRYRMTETIGNKKVKRPEEEHIVVENAHPPIIDIDVFDKAQQKINSKRVTSTRISNKVYGLSGLCASKKTGYNLSVNTVKRKTKEDYTSLRSRYANDISMMKYETVENGIYQFLKLLSNLEDDNELFGYLKDSLDSKRSKNEVNTEELLKQLVKEREKHKRKLDVIYDSYENQVYDIETFEMRKEKVQKEIDKIDASIKNLSNPKKISKDDINFDAVRSNLRNIVQIFDVCRKDNDHSELNQLLRSVFEKIYLYNRGKNSSIDYVFVFKSELLIPNNFISHM